MRYINPYCGKNILNCKIVIQAIILLLCVAAIQILIPAQSFGYNYFRDGDDGYSLLSAWNDHFEKDRPEYFRNNVNTYTLIKVNDGSSMILSDDEGNEYNVLLYGVEAPLPPADDKQGDPGYEVPLNYLTDKSLNKKVYAMFVGKDKANTYYAIVWDNKDEMSFNTYFMESGYGINVTDWQDKTKDIKWYKTNWDKEFWDRILFIDSMFSESIESGIWSYSDSETFQKNSVSSIYEKSEQLSDIYQNFSIIIDTIYSHFPDSQFRNYAPEKRLLLMNFFANDLSRINVINDIDSTYNSFQKITGNLRVYDKQIAKIIENQRKLDEAGRVNISVRIKDALLEEVQGNTYKKKETKTEKVIAFLKVVAVVADAYNQYESTKESGNQKQQQDQDKINKDRDKKRDEQAKKEKEQEKKENEQEEKDKCERARKVYNECFERIQSECEESSHKSYYCSDIDAYCKNKAFINSLCN